MKLEVGMKATFTKTVTSEDIQKYAEITGDYNPLHFDSDFARKTKFGKLVAQGGITSGMLNALVAMKLPGPGTVFLNQQLQYTAPVFIGDTITASGEIIKLHPTKPVTTINVKIIKESDGESVLQGECVCYTFQVE
ncbi:MAG: MaoC family dehydratase [Candidatus Kariarchaeaceae archaeon]|jgi:acyl dehydratase